MARRLRLGPLEHRLDVEEVARPPGHRDAPRRRHRADAPGQPAAVLLPSGGTGGGNIPPGYLQGINSNLHAMSGTTIATFKAEFLLQLEKAIGATTASP